MDFGAEKTLKQVQGDEKAIKPRKFNWTLMCAAEGTAAKNRTALMPVSEQIEPTARICKRRNSVRRTERKRLQARYRGRMRS